MLFLADRDVRRVRMLHADDVIAGVDVMHFAGNAARHVGQQISAGLADLLDGNALGWSEPQAWDEFVRYYIV